MKGAAFPVDLGARPRILVVALRRIGDVLLTTPLIRSLRQAWTDAEIDVLVFAGTEGILDGNPDVNRVIAFPAKPTVAQNLALAARLWKRYALAVATQSGDRPTLFTLIAGRTHAALTGERKGDFWKRGLLGRSVVVPEGLHRVEQLLLLADALGIARASEVVVSAGITRARPPGRYAVIHAAPMFRYKQWTREGWRTLAAGLQQRGLNVIATGGPDEAERQQLDEIWRDLPFVQRRDGTLSWPELAGLLSGAEIYIGPDTSVTHLAAASGCPTVALYGPTDPRIWGPWPRDGLREPWAAAGRIQHRGNIWLVQNPLPCLPCQKEGCDRHIASHSQCLDELTSQQVLTAVDEALRMSTARRQPAQAGMA